MDHVQVQDARIPAVGLGTWQLRGGECRAAVAHACSIGYRHVDTARNYRNEAEVGRGIRDSGIDRSELFITTKVPGSDGDRRGVQRAVSSSLDDLGLDHLDLLLLHQPGPIPIEETMAAFVAEQDAGRVRHLGVSNFSVGQLKAAAANAPIVAVQNEHHPRRPDHDVVRWCQQHGLAFVAYSPLGKGAEVADDALMEIGNTHGKSPAQIAIRWLLQQDNVVTIPRSSRSDHREQNLDVFDFSLTDDEMARIGASGR